MYMTTDLIKVCMDKITERKRREEKSVEMTIKYPDLLKVLSKTKKKNPKKTFFCKLEVFAKKTPYYLTSISDIFMLCLFRSHDGFQEKSDGVLEPAGGSSYASQRRVFEDLGQGVLDNAFEGNKSLQVKSFTFYMINKQAYSVKQQKFLLTSSLCVHCIIP